MQGKACLLLEFSLLSALFFVAELAPGELVYEGTAHFRGASTTETCSNGRG